MIVEMAVNRLRELGFAPGLGTNYITLDASTAFGEGVSGFDSTSAGNIAVTLKALQTKNQAKILSAPSATVLDGKEVDFKVGGEVPLPYTSYGTSGVAGGALTQSVEFKEFGILMNVKPTVLDNDNVNLAIKTEVSQPNYTNAVQIGNSLVPGFDTRNSQTEVVVKHSETLVIGGLIKNELIKNKQALPILSKIPVLGELFQSTSFQRNETELVIFVTPRVLEVK
jgi:pilus assembly protein CpaC